MVTSSTITSRYRSGDGPGGGIVWKPQPTVTTATMKVTSSVRIRMSIPLRRLTVSLTWSPRAGSRLGPTAGPATEHHAGRQAGAAGVVAPEQPAQHLAADEQPLDRCAGGVEDPSVDVAAQPAERERDATRHREGVERRRLERQRPVALRQLQRGPPTVLDGRVEREADVDAGVEVGDGGRQAFRHDPEPTGELVDRVGGLHGAAW